jgi:hypothetical protein
MIAWALPIVGPLLYPRMMPKPRHQATSTGHRRALQLLASWPNGCPDALLIEQGCSVELMVDLIQMRLATLHTQYVRLERHLMETVRLKITATGRQSLAQ